MPDNISFKFSDTPVQQIHDPLLIEQGVDLYLKREDLNDPEIQGNKWLKLKPALIDARARNFSHILTFGGCFSNHIYATAAAGKRFGFKTTGIIRGPEPEDYSPTLKFARENGMQLHFINRSRYRDTRTETGQQALAAEFDSAYVIPEGGTSTLAIDSCAEFITPYKTRFDVVCTAVGTGGTISGFIKGMKNHGQIIGFPALKDANFLYNDIRSLLLEDQNNPRFTNWSLNNDYHFGGYAKTCNELEDFIVDFLSKHDVLLDPVYTGKMMLGLYDLIKKGYFRYGTRILAIHTGGLQGINGFPGLQQKIQEMTKAGQK